VKLTVDDIAALAPLWQPQNAALPEDPRKRQPFFVSGPNMAGVRVTAETAMQVGVVWACIDVIAKAISSSDWLVFERISQKKRKELADDPLFYLLNTRPNPEMTAQSFRRATMIAALSWGNGYAEIVRDRSNRVGALWPIAPDRVEPQRWQGDLGYRVKNDDGSEVWLAQRDMFHVRGPGITGLVGDNMIVKAAGSIALTMATEKFAEAYFGNGTQLGTIMEYPGELDDVTFERLSRAFENKHRGVNRAFRTAWIEQGMKAHQVETDAEKAQLIEAQQQNVEGICRWFGVPPHKVQHLLRSTNNNIEHQGLEFVRDALRPWARELQQEADFKLFSNRGPTRFTLIDLDWASEGDFKSRMEGLQIARNIGGINGNEVRAEIGYDDMGPDGEKFIVQGAMVELKDVGKAFDKPAAAPTPAEEDEPDPEAAAMTAWLTSIYDRAERCRTGNPEKDPVHYLDRQLEDIVPHLERFNDGAKALALDGGRAVFTGTSAAEAAKTTIMAIIGVEE
jgi:HK97 family phage portal protein